MEIPNDFDTATIFDEIFDDLGIGFCLFDAEDRLLTWNRHYLKFFPGSVEHLERGLSYQDTLRHFHEANLAAAPHPRLQDYMAQEIDLDNSRNTTRIYQLTDKRWIKTASKSLSNGFRFKYWQDISELKRLNSQARLLADTDSLTDAYSHRYFMELADELLKIAQRHQRTLALMMIDIDHLRSINDEHGYTVGDKILKQLVNTAQKTLRTTDTVARLGGEEFAVLLPETNLAGALEIAERLRQRLADLEIKLDDTILHFTVSIGVARCPLDGESIYRCLSLTDQALLKAKETGRNRVYGLKEPIE